MADHLVLEDCTKPPANLGFQPPLETGSQVFRDRNALDLDYLPAQLVHRDPQIESLSKTFRPFLEGGRGRNVLNIGLLGTGKTVVSKYTAQRFRDETADKGINILCAYVSCIQHSNIFDVLVKTCRDILGQEVRRGHSLGHYVDMLTQKVQGSNGLILILDEVDRLALRKTGDFSDLLYLLGRSLRRTCVMMITSKRKVADILQEEIDGRSRDTFRWDLVEFPRYDALQLQDILKPRMESAYLPNAYDPGIINKISALCIREGLGARGAIDIARRAGEQAELRGEYTLNPDDVELIAGELIGRLVTEPILSLDYQCKGIAALLLNKETMTNQELEEFYKNQVASKLHAGQSRRILYFHLGHLREAGLLHSWVTKRHSGPGFQGHISIDFSQREIVREALAKEVQD